MKLLQHSTIDFNLNTGPSISIYHTVGLENSETLTGARYRVRSRELL